MAPPTRIIRADKAGDMRKITGDEFEEDIPDIYGENRKAAQTASIRKILSGLDVSGQTLVPRPAPATDETPQPIERANDWPQAAPPPADTYARPKPVAPPMPEPAQAAPYEESAPDFESEEVSGFPSLPTAEELEAIQREAYDEGFETGRTEGEKAGYREGLKEARAEYEARIAEMNNLLVDLHARVAEQDQEVELELVDLATTIASRVLQRELHTHPDHILAAVRAGLAQLPTQQLSARIILNPDDLDDIREHLIPDEPERRWTLIADDTFARGSYRLEAGSAELAVDIQRRLEAAIDAVLNADEHAD
ncbi:MAG: hypothetical protein H6926_04730 [Chromatiales bacterium]|nr:hypothetical protein [Gammaproteobacteria bacterium]MCP5352479.1 hypothetical protein [Chromatiales bacterium]